MFFSKIINKIKFWILWLCLIPLLGNFSMAECSSSTIFGTVFCKSYEEGTMITIWKNPDRVGDRVINWNRLEFNASLDDWVEIAKKPSIVVRIIKFLLSITISLSITVIMYNWMKYIIETWRWKDSKDLVKNIIYIVIWVLVAMFSVLIISLMQSIPYTIDNEIWQPTETQIDPQEILDKEYKDASLEVSI